MTSNFPRADMTPNPAHAQAFLTSLDETSDSWSFQTFDDVRDRKDEKLVRVLHGDLQKHTDELVELNRRGAGIFVTVNETDGRGRAKPNIQRIRAMYVDLDGAPIEPVLAAQAPPHILVQSSPERFHAYWRVTNCPIDACEPALKQLIRRYGSDKSCSDSCRVLRLPGFIHRKAVPYQVHVIEASLSTVINLDGICPVADQAA